MSDNNEIVIELKGIVDTEDAQSQLGTLKQSVSAAKEEVFRMRDAFSEMPHFGQLLNSSLERTGVVADNAIKKLDALSGGRFSSQQEQDDLISRTQSSLRDFGIQRSMQNEDGFFSANSARAWAKKLDKTVQHELDRITPQLTQIIRSKISTIARNGYNFQFSDVASMASEITHSIHGDRDKKTTSLIRSVKHASSDDLHTFMSYLVANAVAPMYLDEYSLKRYGSRASNNKTQFSMNPENVIPDAFKKSWQSRKYQRAFGYSKTGSVLNSAATNLLNEVFATSPAAVRAGLNSGLLSRTSNGVLQRTHLVDEKMLEDFYESMYVDAIQKTKGIGSNRIENIYDANFAKKIAKRMSSGNTGRTWEALGRLSDLRQSAYWMDRPNVYDRTPLLIPSEARPELQMYSTRKYAPFSAIAGRRDYPEYSSISESQNTRKLGFQNRGNYADVSDVVSLLSLEGYDEGNEEHVAQLKGILEKGFKVGNTRMMVQSIHRGTDGIVARLVSQKVMQEVDDAESSFAKEMGLRGSYWKGYQNEVIDQLARDGKLSKVTFGKYQDSLNKGWTPSAQLGLDFDGKRIAIIDTEANGRDVADGIGFISESILPYSIQSRGALGHKGTIRRLPGESLRSFAIRSGAAKWNPSKQASDGSLGDYEWIQRGLGGDLFDIIDYHGFVSASTIKDKNAYVNADGTKMSGEKSSQVFTERLKRDGLGAVTIFDEDGTAADSIGVQMMSFMRLNPELVNNQLTGLIERMRELDTEEGQLKYVFSDPSSSWISRVVNNGEEGRAFLHTEQARNQVDAYRNSLIRKAMSGIFVDYGKDKTNSIANIEIADSPLSIFARMGQIDDDTKKYLREALMEQLGKEYSDSDFEDLLQLRGMSAIDFGKIDEDTIAYLRSPTGYGNMVVAKNRAKEYRVMYDALRKRQINGFAEMSSFADVGGVALSSEIMSILQGADEDGDKVKRLTGIYRDMVARTIETIKTVSEADADIGFVPDETPISDEDLRNKMAEMTFVSNLQKESLGMGSGSAAARGVQLDLSKAGNYDYIKGAVQGQNIYNLLGTQGKKPGSASNTLYATNAMKLGKEYTKFTEGFSKLFALDQDMYDANKRVIVDHPDVFYDEETGLAINMRALKSLDTQHINLPSMNMDNMFMANALSRSLNENGLLETNQVDAIGRAMNAMYQYDPSRLAGAGENTIKLAKIMDSLRIQHAKGERFALEEDEEKGLRSLYFAATEEIRKEAREREIRGRGSVLMDDGTTMSKKAYIESKAKEYGLNIVDNYLNSFGFTRRNLAIRFGQHAFDDIRNSANAALSFDIPVETTSEPAKPKKVIKGFKGITKHNTPSEQTIEVSEKEDTHKTTSAKEHLGFERFKMKDGKLHTEIVNPDGVFDGRNAIMEYDPELPLISQLQILQDANAQRAAIDNFLDRSREYRSSFNKDIFRDKERTAAENYYGKATYFRDITNSDAEALLATIKDPATRRMIEDAQADIQSGYISATSKWSSNYNTSQLEALKKAASEVGDEFAAQEAKLRSFDQIIENINSNIENFINSRNALGGLTPEEDQQVDEMRRQKSEAEKYRAQAIQRLKDETGESYFEKLYSIQETVIGKALSPAQRVDLQISKNRRNIEGTLDGLKGLSEEDIEKYFNRSEYDEIVKRYEDALRIVSSNDYRNQLLKKYRHQAQRDETRDQMQTLQQSQYIEQLKRSAENDALRETLDRTGFSSTAIGQNLLRSRERYNYYVSKHENAQRRIAEENAYIDEQRNVIKTSADETERKIATKNIQEASVRLREYYKELDRAKDGMDRFSGAADKMRAGMDAIGQSVSRAVAQFGRNMFHKAIQEAQQFVMTYDDAMTEIQMVTLKTEDEISSLGDNLLDAAINLKAPIESVTSSAAALYRQGLGDDDVEARLNDVLKFTTTAKVQADQAIKLITVAMSNGMVESSKEAMDVVSALSDSAATEADQITKGLQKSMAAAKEVGVEYDQLVAMLTVITSKTQLSGSVAGTTMRNVLSRLSRTGGNELIIDDSGNAMSASQQSRILQSAGVKTYEDGEFRGAFQILTEIGQKWNDLSDAKRNQVAFALGGTEQFSNVSALMQGFSEVDEFGNNLLERYLKIAEASSGTTDEKYLHYTESLTAAMTNLNNTFDSFVDSVINGTGAIQGVIGFFADTFEGFSKFNRESGGVVTGLLGILGAIGLIAAAITNWPVAIVSGIVGGLGLIGTNLKKLYEDLPTITEKSERIAEHYNDIIKLVDKAEKLNDGRDSSGLLSDGDRKEFEETIVKLNGLGVKAFDASTNIGTLATNAEKASAALSNVKEAALTMQAQQKANLVDDASEDINTSVAEYEKKTPQNIDINEKRYDTDWDYEADSSIAELAKDYYRYMSIDPNDTNISQDDAEFYASISDTFRSPEDKKMYQQAAVLFKDAVLSAGLRIDSLHTDGTPFSNLNAESQNAWISSGANQMFGKEMTDYIANWSNFLVDDSFAPGTHNLPKIKEVLSVQDYEHTGLLDAVASDIAQRMDAGYDTLDDKTEFDAKSYFADLYDAEKHTYTDDKLIAYAKANTPDAYNEYIKMHTVGGDDKASLTPYGAMAAVAEAASGSAIINEANLVSLEKMYEAYNLAPGDTPRQKLENAPALLLSGSEKGYFDEETFETFISDSKHTDLAKMFSEIYVKDEKTGDYHPMDGAEQPELDALLNLLRSQYASEADLSTYRSDGVRKLSALRTATYLGDQSGRYDRWMEMPGTSGSKEIKMRDFVDLIGGEEVANKFIHGEYDLAGENYLIRKISGANTDTPPLSNEELLMEADTILNKIDQGTGLDYIRKLPTEMISDIYAVSDGLKEYIEALAHGTKSSDELNAMRYQVETNMMLARVPMGDYSDEIQAKISELRGDEASQLSSAFSTNAEQGKYERGKYALDRIVTGEADSRDYDSLIAALGGEWNEEEIRKAAQSEDGRRMMDKTLRTNARRFTYITEQVLMRMLDPAAISRLSPGMSTEEIIQALSEFLTDGEIAIIQSTGAITDADGISIPINPDPGYGTASSAYSYAKATYSGPSDEFRMINYFVDALKNNEVASGNKSIVDYFGSNNAAKTEDWNKFYSEHPEIMLAQGAFETGDLSINGFMARLEAALYGDETKGKDYYQPSLDALYANAENEDGSMDYSVVAQNYASMLGSDFGNAMLDDIMSLDGGIDLLSELSEILKGNAVDADRCSEAFKKVTDSIGARQLAQITKFSKANEKIVDTFKALAAGGSDAADAYNDLMVSTRNLSNAEWALRQYKSGSRSNKVTDILSTQFGLDSKALKKASKADAEAMISTMEMAYSEQFEILKKNFEYNFSDISEYIAQAQANTGGEFQIKDYVVNGKVNISALLKAFSDAGVIVDQTWAAVVKAMAASATFGVTADGDQVKLDLTNIAGTGTGYYGGGGGSKKSSADKLVERIGHGRELYEHQVKMVQYEQTKYENADELGNYGKMLEEQIKIEKSYLPVVEANIKALETELGNVKKGTEDWYKLRNAILDAEELYSEITNSIEENTDKLEENQQAILKLRTDLEEMVVAEIELRLEAEREQLDATVSMEDTILSAIKQRYQDEWDLIKKDIEKKKEALQEEKDLIDERLDARREAEDEAAKYEELTELKKQLSLISMDSTRTRDAAELRESIAELEKEIGWDIAEKEAENEKNAIQDQIDAYDDYMTKGDEDLENLLENANNFSEEVNSVMKLNQEELFNWLKQNVKEYANSLEDAQIQMVKSWEDTYKKMLGITDTYWDEVNAILSSKESFIEYMKQSKEYIYASDDERAQLLYQWEQAYDKWRSAQKTDAEYDHNDNGLGNFSGSEYTGGSSSSSGGGSSGGSSNSSSSSTQTGVAVLGSGAPYYVKDIDGKLLSQVSDAKTAKAIAAQQAKDKGKAIHVYDSKGTLVARFMSTGAESPGFPDYTYEQTGSSSSSSFPETGWPAASPNGKTGLYFWKVTSNGVNVDHDTIGYSSRSAAQDMGAKAAAKYPNGKYTTKYYLHGGIADFTGPVWVDGTKEAPERILNAEQTEDFDQLVSILDDLESSGLSPDLLRNMMKWSTTVTVPSSVSHVGSDAFKGTIANIGDIHVTVNEANITDDRDIDDLAQIVGEKFVKEISKQGFNVSRYQL